MLLIREYFLIHLALTNIVFSSIHFTDIEMGKLDTLFDSLGTETFEKDLQLELWTSRKINDSLHENGLNSKRFHQSWAHW